MEGNQLTGRIKRFKFERTSDIDMFLMYEWPDFFRYILITEFARGVTQYGFAELYIQKSYVSLTEIFFDSVLIHVDRHQRVATRDVIMESVHKYTEIGTWITNPVAVPTQIMESPVEEHEGDLVIEIRASDGFVNGTRMCASRGKQWDAYHQSLKKYKSNILSDIMISGYKKNGTWVRPRVAIDLATWISSAFEVAVKEILARYDSRTMSVNGDANESQVSEITTIPARNLLLVAKHEGEIITSLRTSDGFVNATKLCSSSGKGWCDYFKRTSTKELIKESKDVVDPRSSRQFDIWVKPHMAVDLATWIGPEFAEVVTDLVTRYNSRN
jgi:hypothetical protein